MDLLYNTHLTPSTSLSLLSPVTSTQLRTDITASGLTLEPRRTTAADFSLAVSRSSCQCHQADKLKWHCKTMNKLIDFGKKAMFYVRVLSGYEERRIRSYRLDLEKRIIEAERKKAEIRKIPEQLILSEVRQMVEEMKAVNKQLEDTEAAINEYFSPVDKQAEMIVEMQLKEEEKTMKQMMQTMKAQAFLDQEEAHKNANLKISETKQETPDNDSTNITKAQAG
uniref:Uncharacterized protein n=1 Tax=Lactuca sativa TaxID=4236 RepID=A0A9R1W5E8_LACSA|nr:hypothetical protein LSAT_V11C300107650 [Lactuca sativa]